MGKTIRNKPRPKGKTPAPLAEYRTGAKAKGRTVGVRPDDSGRFLVVGERVIDPADLASAIPNRGQLRKVRKALHRAGFRRLAAETVPR